MSKAAWGRPAARLDPRDAAARARARRDARRPRHGEPGARAARRRRAARPLGRGARLAPRAAAAAPRRAAGRARRARAGLVPRRRRTAVCARVRGPLPPGGAPPRRRRGGEDLGVVPGPSFSTDGAFEHYLRLPYTLPERDLDEAVLTLPASPTGSVRSVETPAGAVSRSRCAFAAEDDAALIGWIASAEARALRGGRRSPGRSPWPSSRPCAPIRRCTRDGVHGPGNPQPRSGTLELVRVAPRTGRLVRVLLDPAAARPRASARRSCRRDRVRDRLRDRRLELKVYADNAAAIRAYRRLGFADAGEYLRPTCACGPTCGLRSCSR